ncbi:MAG TPA: hypothetical protein VNT32_12115 [Thermoleophilaceae bacterium]|nr:hypothetical protein [Thermoleophilaceae bacterium]
MGRRLRILGGAGWRFAIILLIVLAMMLMPLLLVHRAEGCAKAGKRDTRWTLVLPGGDPPEGCRESRSGFDVLKDEIEG